MIQDIARVVATLATAFAVQFATVDTAFGQPHLLPNITALPADDLSVQIEIDPITLDEMTHLRFAATSWNNGSGPLELYADAGSTGGQDVWQRVYNTDGSTTNYLAGTFEYHPTHYHFHMASYARYTLAPLGTPPGIANRSSIKTSFCILDTTTVNTTLPGAPSQPVYDSCNPVVQGMSVGWGDRYGAHLSGQSIDITGNPDGFYELTLEFDPENRLKESDSSDNVSCLLLDIAASSRQVSVVGPCGSDPGEPPGGVSVSSVEPTQGAKGTSFFMTITGAGFTEGIAVGFENGSGPAPVVSSVELLSDTMIRATVTIKRKGGGKRARTWDLRVGSAVLASAFTVLP